MGMGYGANTSYVIKNEDVKHICSKEYGRIEELLKKYNVSFENLAFSIRFDANLEVDEDIYQEDIFATYDELQKKFMLKTGLRITIDYHSSSEDGDRYDEVDGGFFVVEWLDVVQLSPSAQKLKENGVDLQLKQWVTYG